jgi:hypothetical protein
MPLDVTGAAAAAVMTEVGQSLNPAAMPSLRSPIFAGMDRSALEFGQAVASSGQSDPWAS